jgi:hypothetical protein
MKVIKQFVKFIVMCCIQVFIKSNKDIVYLYFFRKQLILEGLKVASKVIGLAPKVTILAWKVPGIARKGESMRD